MPFTANEPTVFLVGAGVVGNAILKAHIDAGISVWIADQDESAIESSVDELNLDQDRWAVAPTTRIGERLYAIALNRRSRKGDSDRSTRRIVIESISEKLEIKREFFCEAEAVFGDEAVLCTNTSTLRIGQIAESLGRPQRLCGMHFFMPVDRRTAVELIAGRETDPSSIKAAADHARRIGKEPLLVGDGPCFVVNRLLSPYLNESMLMLGLGASAESMERAALSYGMPLSPLELIDWIGARTMFDAGRVYWQAFPQRVDPSPMLGAMIKRKLLGRVAGEGFYEYRTGGRSDRLSARAVEVCERYRRDGVRPDDDEIEYRLSIPMWIEGALALREGVARSVEQLNQAVEGGLGYRNDARWTGYFQTLGRRLMLEQINRWSPTAPSMRAPEKLLRLLEEHDPRAAMERFAATGE